jgi:excinuclease ABC subunit A
MPKRADNALIRLRGVRHNNLKNFDLDLPTGKLIAITGLSGSGKSSLAFDTLFAEGQRRYIETFSPYARQFFDRMDKPQVDRIEGIPPAIAIEQRNSVKTTRSTVGTMTELCEYMKLLWPHLARLYCRGCGKPVEKDAPQSIWARAIKLAPEEELLVTFDVPLSEKLSLDESLLLINKQGYQRLLQGGDVLRIEEASARLKESGCSSLTIIQDRLKTARENRARFIEACEQAYHFGKGRLVLYTCSAGKNPAVAARFSKTFHCANCDIEYREPVPAMFSFNNPVGACVLCRGFGRTISIDYNLALPDRTKTLAEGAVKPWQTGHGLESQQDLLKFCRKRDVPIDVPFEKLERHWQDWVIDGDADYGKDPRHEWPHAWYGVKGYFGWLESKAYKMHVRVMLSRYRTYTPCPDCGGQRLQPESLLYKMCSPDGALLNLAEFYKLPIQTTLQLIDTLSGSRLAKTTDPIALALNEVRSRLGYLVDVGLGYLTLDRPTRSLSGGETERVNLTTCLGTRLVNTLFVLDEPSVGLHARDTGRLVEILRKLRDTGNTVVVVEHEPAVMRAADEIVDLGPGHGESGGHVVFQGSYRKILGSKESLTGQYLSKAREVGASSNRRFSHEDPHLLVHEATCHNLDALSVRIPLNRFVCLTGVSGSGKTTLVREIVQPFLEAHLKRAATRRDETEDEEQIERELCGFKGRITGWHQIGRVVMVDQSALGRTPRSNPVVYIGAFDDIRELFAQNELAQQRGLSASAFSFNSAQGQCERCRGAGFEKIEMQFLSDVYIRCPECNGRRYRSHILDVKLRTSSSKATVEPNNSALRTPRSKLKTVKSVPQPLRDWSIADLLDATVDEAIEVLLPFFHITSGRRALQSLKLLQELGLGYLRLGQPINTLSGGESQRLKLAGHMAEFMRDQESASQRTLFLFDEPTTGLHFEDIRILLKAFQRLVEEGHSLLVIEHNLDLIRAADWIIDLGPEAGEGGGKIVAVGTPEEVAHCEASHTGRALREHLELTNSLKAVA